jgi:hypothetical protein
MEPLVHVRVLDASGAPLAGNAYRVRLYDQDALFDDFLGEAHPDGDGRVDLVFDPTRIKSLDSPRETRPDLYVTIVRGGDELARSPVARDVDLTAVDPETRRPERRTIDLGELRVRSV